MSFIQNGTGLGYAPGWFLAEADCSRQTRTIPQNHAQVKTTAEGGKYVPMGAVFPSNDANAIGIVYEDVDVTTGAMPGSVVTAGVIYGEAGDHFFRMNVACPRSVCEDGFARLKKGIELYKGIR